MEINGGLIANYNLSEAGEKQLIGGLYYRHQDAIIPMVGFELKNVRFTFSYDATISSLKDFNITVVPVNFRLLKKGFYPFKRRQAIHVSPSFNEQVKGLNAGISLFFPIFAKKGHGSFYKSAAIHRTFRNF
jgi:hypothetical protein